MDRSEYERIARETVQMLPEAIRKQVEDVAIVIDERPLSRRGQLLLGQYEGVPITEWGRERAMSMPDKITLFPRAIEASARSEADVPDIVRETLWHEIAHFFGFDHGKIAEMEERWHERRPHKD